MCVVYIVDLQGFRGNNQEFIVKTLAFIPTHFDQKIEQIIFKPPFDFGDLNLKRQEEVKFRVNCLRIPEWNEGFVDYSLLEDTVLAKFEHVSEIIVKGFDSANFLNKTLKRKICMDADRLFYPGFEMMKTAKSVDKDLPVASLHVKLLNDWFQELMKNWISLMDQSVFSYRKNGLHCMSDFEIYFLPARLLIRSCSTDTLVRNKTRFPPRLLDELNFTSKDEDEVD